MLEINDNVNTRSVSVVKSLLHKYQEAPPRKRQWNYHAVIGMLNYIQASTQPDIAMVVRQCGRFCIKPIITNERAIMQIGKYLMETKDIKD